MGQEKKADDRSIRVVPLWTDVSREAEGHERTKGGKKRSKMPGMRNVGVGQASGRKAKNDCVASLHFHEDTYTPSQFKTSLIVMMHVFTQFMNYTASTRDNRSTMPDHLCPSASIQTSSLCVRWRRASWKC